MSTRNRRSGFTLIELLTVLVVLAVVTTLAGRAFYWIVDGWSRTLHRTEMDRKAEQAIEVMRKDLAAIVPPSLAGRSLVGAAEQGQSPTLECAIATPTEVEGCTVGALATYQLADGVLERHTQLLAGEGGSKTDLASGVAAVHFEYAPAGGGPWQPAWTADALPKAVRVSIVVFDPDRTYRGEVARKAVIPIYVE